MPYGFLVPDVPDTRIERIAIMATKTAIAVRNTKRVTRRTDRLSARRQLATAKFDDMPSSGTMRRRMRNTEEV
jgi:hypothetical protein